MQRRHENQPVVHRCHVELSRRGCRGDPGEIKSTVGDPDVAARHESGLVTCKVFEMQRRKLANT